MRTLLARMLAIAMLAFGVQLAAPQQVVHAQGLGGQACNALRSASDTGCTEEDTTRVENTIENAIDVLSVLGGIIAVIMIIVAGLRFILSGGNSEAAGKARNGIIYACVGLIIIAFAQVISNYVLDATINATPTPAPTRNADPTTPQGL